MLETDDYFSQRRDATGKLGASTDRKLLCALEQICGGSTAFATTTCYILSKPVANESIKRFCRTALTKFSPEYLRLSTMTFKRSKKPFRYLGFGLYWIIGLCFLGVRCVPYW